MDQAEDTSIMVIGIDSHFCYLMRRYVKKSQHPIVFAYIGEDALAMAKRSGPAAIVLEVDQPDRSGWKLLHMLKSDSLTQHIPVVLCSWTEDEQNGLSEGADAFLRKPILFNDFTNALETIGIHTCR